MGWLFLWSIVEHTFSCIVSIPWTRKLGKCLKLRTYLHLLETICLAILKYFLFVLICNYLTKSYIIIVVFCKVHDFVSKNDFFATWATLHSLCHCHFESEFGHRNNKEYTKRHILCFFAVNHLRKMRQLSCFVILNQNYLIVVVIVVPQSLL